MSYPEMNQIGQKISIGSEGLIVLPFGNGAERIFANKNIGGSISGLNFNTHGKAHLARAIQEGIAFAFRYGVDIMKSMGMKLNIVKAGNANMFLSPLFCEAISNICGVQIDIYNTDGATGAARGAGVGAGIYNSFEESFNNLKKVKEIFPDPRLQSRYEEAYVNWNQELTGKLI